MGAGFQTCCAQERDRRRAAQATQDDNSRRVRFHAEDESMPSSVKVQVLREASQGDKEVGTSSTARRPEQTPEAGTDEDQQGKSKNTQGLKDSNARKNEESEDLYEF
eukprot:TRINITY_DN108724_c0_g1_i1.p1 TRINITY_DN108724_c0_g1~~TRINITY_DN108724_c0_g1_i1.p1  ORF type:complete len:124 (-),score=31.22 TRINITY_DN108724_c0_g1_i1:61-381(-)